METGKKFNTLNRDEYLFIIENHHNYSDFNTLGLYRSLKENPLLTISEKIEVRHLAHTYFRKSFDFLVLKDPRTYFDVSTIGSVLTIADERQIWKNIIAEQQKILEIKKIRHRNFGDYSKHTCGYSDCPLNGLMTKQDSVLSEGKMHFKSDKNKTSQKVFSGRRKKERKNQKFIIRTQLDEETADGAE